MPSRREIASILFGIASLPVEYLAYLVFPSIPITYIIIATVAILVIAIVLYFTGKKELSVPDAIARSTQQKRVADKLDTHYRRIIDRMDQTWDYRPSYGEQIFTKGNLAQRPKGLEQDKKHLKTFENAWALYSNGSVLYSEYEQADGQARKRILDDLMDIEPSLSSRLQQALPVMIMERIDYIFRTGTLSSVPSFYVHNEAVGSHAMVWIDREMLDVIGENTWTPEKARQLASRMDKMVYHPEILYLADQRRKALANLSRNQSEFLSARDEIVRRARNIDSHLPELMKGECDECKPLKEELQLFSGGRVKS